MLVNKSLVQLLNVNRDIFYELLKYLELNNVKNLCSSNREIRKICQDKRFEQLFKEKLKEEKEEKIYQEKVNKIFYKIKYGFYNKIDHEIHKIVYYGTPKGQVLEEEFKVDKSDNDYRKQSILRRLFGEEAMIRSKGRKKGGVRYDGPRYKLIKPTEEKVKKVLNVLVRQPNLDITCF